MLNLSNNLAFLRKQKKLSLADFALLIGVWEDTLRRYEKGKAEPDLETLLSISDHLNIPVEHLLRRNMDLQHQRMNAKSLKLVLLDIDGTMTDGGMYYTESGDQFKRFNVHDGMMIHRMITRHGMKFGFISSGSAEGIIRRRAETLGVQFVHAGREPKTDIIDTWLKQLNLTYESIAYVGDDLNDLAVLKKAGISACPADAVMPVKMAVDVVLSRKGGQGCVRELLEEVLGYDVLE